MATVMFSTVGHALGGPLGAVTGALIGSTIDTAVFGKGQSSGNLLVQRSAYGEIIPRLYGRTRTAGIVIWALPMKQGGSKGSGRKAYATSFAVALSSRPIRSIGRIWADGSEIRNANGEFETETRMRVYAGGGRQAADPVIVAAEGNDGAPGYQGLAYVVFEDFAVGDFGNRIPNLSFEVFADEDLQPDDWIRDLADTAALDAVIQGAGSTLAIGYVAGGVRWKEDVAALSRLGNVDLGLADGGVWMTSSPRVIDIPEAEVASPVRTDQGGNIRRTALGDWPGGLSISYFDPERDYQAGRQHAMRGRGGNMLALNDAVTATASMARHMADRELRRAEAAATTCEIVLSWRWLHVTVGDVLAIEGVATRWRVVRREIEGMLVRLEAQMVPFEPVSDQHAGDAGRALSAPAMKVPPSQILVFEAPVPLRADGSGIGAWVMASGSAGWRGAELRWLSDSGETFLGDQEMILPRGHLLEALFPGPTTTWDEKNTVVVSFDSREVSFESRAREAVLAGANLVRVGEELLQFRTATLLNDNIVRLSGLLRGRFGTGHAVQMWPAGANVQELAIDQLLFVPLNADAVGREMVVTASGRGDPAGGKEAALILEGAGHAPLAPVHVRGTRLANGGVEFTWVGRDRNHFEWSSREMPGQQNYLCHIRASVGGQGMERSIRVTGNDLHYSAAAQNSDFGELPEALEFWVVAEGDGPEPVRTSRRIEVAL